MQHICPTCRTSVPAGLHGIRLNCSHWVHTRCLRRQSAPDFDNCEACKGLVDMSVPLVSADEPSSLDGHDYVAEPIASHSYLPSFGRAKREPFSLLAERKPLDWMIREKGWNLQKLLKAGVRIEDFLNAGYEWSDLKAFRDFSSAARSRNPEKKDSSGRGIQALYALGCNAEHFRDYAHLLGDAISDLGITGRHLVEVFGLVFPQGKSLGVTGGKNERSWLAAELTPMGMTMDDLFGAGMEMYEQWDDLQASPQDEKALGVTQEHFGYLHEPVQFRMEPVPIPIPIQSRAERVIGLGSTLPREEEEEEEIALPEPVRVPARPRLHGLKKR